MDAYQKGPVIGEGTYGSVICATHKASGKQVAIKKVRMCNGKEGINMSVLRELKALKALSSQHVVELLDVFTMKNSLVLVFEYMEWSLEDVIRDKTIPLSAADVKSYMQMILQGLAYVHGQDVVHRDVKPDNMLIGSDMQLKLADFGLARSLDASPDGSKMTPQVFGRWYRPPELLMGCSNYGTAVDIWAAGCVLAELLLRKPWFPGVCDMDQLDRIFKALGVPTLESWPGLIDLPHRIDFKPADGKPLKQIFPQANADCLDLLKQLMQFDPQRRISAAAALQHPYFSSEPVPTPPNDLPRPAASRAGRRTAAMVPAILHEMLMQPAFILRQQQQQLDQNATAAAGNFGSSRQLFAFSGHSTSFSGRLLGGPGVQQSGPSAADSLLGDSGNRHSMNGGSRLCRGGSNGNEQLSSLLDDGPALPWKGRLSFGSIADEPIGPAAEQQQEQQQQQQLYKRPSPMHQQQQQQGKAGSMRPPLHRNSLAGQHGSTPLPARPGSAGAAAMGSGDAHASAAAAAAAGAGLLNANAMAGRRRVSDLAAALSSAAAGVPDGLGSSSLAGSLLVASAAPGHLHQQQGAAADEVQGFPASTPAVRAVAVRADVVATAAAKSTDAADMACPLSMSTGAHKRSRALFEAAAAQPGMQLQGSEADSMQEQQQQQQPAAMMSAGGTAKRMVRGRRSSMGSGCCSMETDGAPPSTGGGVSQQQHYYHQQQQQQYHQQQHFQSSLEQVPETCAATVQHASSGSSQLGIGADVSFIKQQELEALLAGKHCQQQHFIQPSEQQQPTKQQLQQHGYHQQLQHSNDCQHQGAHLDAASKSLLLQLQHPWPSSIPNAALGQQLGQDQAAAAAAAGGGADSDLGSVRRQVGAGLGHLHPTTVAPGQLHDGLQDCTAQQPDSGCCPMSLDQRTAAAHGRSHDQRSHYAASSGMKTGGSSVAPCTRGGVGGVDLQALDPAELAEMAAWWRPRLDSAERRYLRCRKLQMDEALLQASQHDDEEAPDNTFGSPEFHLSGALFGSPLGPGDEQQRQEAAAVSAAADGHMGSALRQGSSAAAAAAAGVGAAAAAAGAGGSDVEPNSETLTMSVTAP